LCQMPGKVFSALAAPDDDVLILFRTHKVLGCALLPG
jgi:hypothetical protein